MIDREDILSEIFLFLNPKDGLNLGLCSKSVLQLYLNELIWNQYCLLIAKRHIPNLTENDNRLYISVLMNAIKIKSFRYFYQMFSRVHFCILGNYRIMTRFPYGGFFRIVVRTKDEKLKLYLEEIGLGSHGTNITSEIEYDEETNQIALKGYSQSTYYMRRSRRNNDLVFQANNEGDFLLESIQNITPPSIVFAEKPVLKCLGLHKAVYGSHGPELIHVSVKLRRDTLPFSFSWLSHFPQSINSLLNSTSDNFIPDQDNNCPSIAYPRLQGYKITGDPNVPSGRYSFLIDLITRINPSAMASEDSRGIASFQMTDRAVLFSIDELLPHIMWCYRGKGQINVTPLSPQYYWVDCTLLTYRNEQSDANGTNETLRMRMPSSYNTSQFPGSPFGVPAFSILWHDADQSFRHIMHFR
jgi:hypothetical protein